MSRRHYIIDRSHAYRYRRKYFSKKIFFGLVLAGIVVSGAGYGVFYSGLFSITRINLEGFARTPQVEVHSLIADYMQAQIFNRISQNNYFLLSPETIKDRIYKRFPELADVIVAKDFPNRIQVTIRERVFAGIWCSARNGECFNMDDEGVLYDEAASTSGTLVMQVKSQREAHMGDTVLEPAKVTHLTEIRGKLRERFGFAIQEFNMDELPDVIAEVADDWQLRFDINRPVKETVDGFQKTMTTIDPAQRLEYIDLRIEGRAYYKAIETMPSVSPEPTPTLAQ